jgi:predicted dehydrogenase
MRAGASGKIRVGVVGTGYLGRFHAEKYAALEGAELVGVVDTEPARARAVAESTGCRVFPSAESLCPLVDAVSVVVPTSLHHEVARGFLRAGVDVLVEKPMTATIAEANDLVRLAGKVGCILQVGHLERFNPVWEVAGPALKEPRFIEAHRLGPFRERGTDVDVVLDLMIHDIDLCLKYVASPVRQIDSVGVPVLTPSVDIANVRIRFQNGTLANLTASRVSVKRTRKIRFFQPDLYVSVDCDVRTAQIIRRVPDEQGGSPRIEGEEKTLPERDALAAELGAFVDSVRTRRPPEVGGEEGRRALDVALRILRRMRSS